MSDLSINRCKRVPKSPFFCTSEVPFFTEKTGVPARKIAFLSSELHLPMQKYLTVLPLKHLSISVKTLKCYQANT